MRHSIASLPTRTLSESTALYPSEPKAIPGRRVRRPKGHVRGDPDGKRQAIDAVMSLRPILPFASECARVFRNVA
jgi:hypothetical protein